MLFVWKLRSYTSKDEYIRNILSFMAKPFNDGAPHEHTFTDNLLYKMVRETSDRKILKSSMYDTIVTSISVERSIR